MKRVISVLIAVAAVTGLLFLVSAPVGGGHGEDSESVHEENIDQSNH